VLFTIIKEKKHKLKDTGSSSFQLQASSWCIYLRLLLLVGFSYQVAIKLM